MKYLNMRVALLQVVIIRVIIRNREWEGKTIYKHYSPSRESQRGFLFFKQQQQSWIISTKTQYYLKTEILF